MTSQNVPARKPAPAYYTLELAEAPRQGEPERSPRARLSAPAEHAPYTIRNVVVTAHGRVFMSTDLFRSLQATSAGITAGCVSPGPYWTVGRAKLHEVTPEVLERALTAASYPNRNARETFVAERNLDALALLEGLRAA